MGFAPASLAVMGAFSGALALGGLGLDVGRGQAAGQLDLAADHLLIDHEVIGVLASRELVEQIEQDALEDRAQGPHTRLALDGETGDRVEAGVGELEALAVHDEQSLELAHECVLRLHEDPDQLLAAQGVEGGDDPALRISRSLTAAPNPAWVDQIATALIEESMHDVALRSDLEKAHDRAARNRDKALEQFPPTVIWNEGGVVFYDASSSKVRRERFAPFYHHPDVSYAVGVIPTRAGSHITCGENPWNKPEGGIHVGELMEQYGGGGHRAVGGANPPSLAEAQRLGEEVAELIVRHLAAR